MPRRAVVMDDDEGPPAGDGDDETALLQAYVGAEVAAITKDQEDVYESDEVDVHFAEVSSAVAGMRICSKLSSQGFCAVDSGVDMDVVREAHKNIRDIGGQGLFQRPPMLVSDGLLGNGSSQVADVPELDEASEHAGLYGLAKTFTSIGDCLSPYAENTSFAFSHRSSFMLHRYGSLDVNGEYIPVTEASARRWEPLLAYQRVIVILFLGPGNATLEMLPHVGFNANTFAVALQPGSMVLVRPDILEAKLIAKDRALTLTSLYLTVGRQNKIVAPMAARLGEWILDYLEELKEQQTIENVSLWGSDLPRDWQLLMNHSFYRGNYIPVMGQAIRVPTTTDQDAWASISTAGGDIITEIPVSRWDHKEYYDEDMESWKSGKTYCWHAGFADGFELFDPQFFAMSPAEAVWAAPHQRMVLDCGYAALANAGYTRKTLMNSRLAHITAFGSLQWNFIDKSHMGTGGAYGTCGEAAAVVAARLSYVFGMKGNCFTLDTEGASGLSALYSSCDAIQDKGKGMPDTGALTTASHMNLTPCMWPRMCAAGLLSKNGRCLSFSEAADGYVQTDGIVACVIKPLPQLDEKNLDDDADLGVGLICAMAMNHNGMGASLTAPKGPSEQEIVVEAAQNAMISTLDVDAVECHSAGAYLADAVELSSLVRAHRSEEHNDPLGLMANKSNAGNMIWPAGLAAFLKVLWNAKRGVMNPIAHLGVINPQFESVEDAPPLVLTEAISYRSQMGSYTGTMSRGFGGTNVYAISRGSPPQPVEEQHMHENMLSYWPGGGGRLDPGSEVKDGYYIMGSFNGWQAERMCQDKDGTAYHQLRVPEEGIPEFVISLDGDTRRIIHPQNSQVHYAGPVAGPDQLEECEKMHWFLYGEDLQPATPGDEYVISLQTAGHWRTLSWQKLESAAER